MTHEMQQLVLAISFRSSQSVLGSDVEVPLSDLARSVVHKVSATFLVEFIGLLAGWFGSRDPLGTNPWDRRSTWCRRPCGAAFLRSAVVLSMHWSIDTLTWSLVLKSKVILVSLNLCCAGFLPDPSLKVVESHSEGE